MCKISEEYTCWHCTFFSGDGSFYFCRGHVSILIIKPDGFCSRFRSIVTRLRAEVPPNFKSTCRNCKKAQFNSVKDWCSGMGLIGPINPNDYCSRFVPKIGAETNFEHKV